MDNSSGCSLDLLNLTNERPDIKLSGSTVYCEHPMNVSVDSITSHYAILSWTDASLASFEYKTSQESWDASILIDSLEGGAGVHRESRSLFKL